MASSHTVWCEMMLYEGRRKSSANFASASKTSPHASTGLMEVSAVSVFQWQRWKPLNNVSSSVVLHALQSITPGVQTSDNHTLARH